MFTGRIGRLGFLLGCIYLFLPLAVAIGAYMLINMITGGHQLNGGSVLYAVLNILIFLIGAVSTVLFLPAYFGLLIRRWHDIEQSGWFSPLALIPWVGLIVLLVLLFVRGTAGSNKYGEPRHGYNFRAVLFPKKPMLPQPVAETNTPQ